MIYSVTNYNVLNTTKRHLIKLEHAYKIFVLTFSLFKFNSLLAEALFLVLADVSELGKEPLLAGKKFNKLTGAVLETVKISPRSEVQN